MGCLPWEWGLGVPTGNELGEWETSWVHCLETHAGVSRLRFLTPLEAGRGGAVMAGEEAEAQEVGGVSSPLETLLRSSQPARVTPNATCMPSLRGAGVLEAQIPLLTPLPSGVWSLKPNRRPRHQLF